MTKKLLFTLRHAPYGNSIAKEAIDAVLAASAYGQTLTVLFMDDGVFQLVQQQQTIECDHNKQEKNIAKLISALAIYDVEPLFACAESLQQRGLSLEQLCDNVILLTKDDMHKLLQTQDHLLSF